MLRYKPLLAKACIRRLLYNLLYRSQGILEKDRQGVRHGPHEPTDASSSLALSNLYR